MSKHMEGIIREAIVEGLLTAGAAESTTTSRPWPVVVMTAVAAWFVAVPLGAFLALTFLSDSSAGSAMVVVGGIVLTVAIAVLRIPSMPLFAEQLAFPGLIIGVGLLAIGMYDEVPRQTLFEILAAVTLSLAAAVRQSWLRALLGAAAANLVAFAWSPHMRFDATEGKSQWLSWHIVAGAWLTGHIVLRAVERSARTAAAAAALEATLAGVGTMVLLGLTYYSGSRTFLVDATLRMDGYLNTYYPEVMLGIEQQVSVTCVVAASVWLAHQWPALRSWWFGAIAAVAALVCWFAMSLGAVLLVMAVCVSSGRRNLAVLAGVAALWMVGAFYYQLSWPLVHKALLLLGCGAALGAVARFALPAALAEPMMPVTLKVLVPVENDHRKRQVIACCGALVLVVANAAIWQKEDLIRNGAAVFVELAPVDPRSLMQGDYMALNFLIPDELFNADLPRTHVIGRRGVDGVVKLLRPHDGSPLAKGDMLIELVRKNGRNVLVTDAWFFAEGEAERWSRAKYGEFRVVPDGRALLVGLRGTSLEKL